MAHTEGLGAKLECHRARPAPSGGTPAECVLSVLQQLKHKVCSLSIETGERTDAVCRCSLEPRLSRRRGVWIFAMATISRICSGRNSNERPLRGASARISQIRLCTAESDSSSSTARSWSSASDHRRHLRTTGRLSATCSTMCSLVRPSADSNTDWARCASRYGVFVPRHQLCATDLLSCRCVHGLSGMRISEQSGHSFRCKVAAQFGAKWPPVSV